MNPTVLRGVQFLSARCRRLHTNTRAEKSRSVIRLQRNNLVSFRFCLRNADVERAIFIWILFQQVTTAKAITKCLLLIKLYKLYKLLMYAMKFDLSFFFNELRITSVYLRIFVMKILLSKLILYMLFLYYVLYLNIMYKMPHYCALLFNYGFFLRIIRCFHKNSYFP